MINHCGGVRTQSLELSLPGPKTGPQEPTAAKVAPDCGYYDQAHFIHEFRSFSGLTPTGYLVVPDADTELAFLKAEFGGTEVMCQRNADNTVMHAEVTVGDSLIMLGQSGGQWTARPAALYLWVGDVDATYARALAAGATSESEPEDKPHGHRNAGVVDQNGITWWIGAPVK